MILKKMNLNKLLNFKRKTSIINDCLIILFFISQIIFWYFSENIKPHLDIIPDVPSPSMVKFYSVGDEEFLFRYFGFTLQNIGDTFGRFTPLKNYNYNKLSQWFYLLDELDDKSNYIPSLAAYYYSSTQNHNDLIYIINYLDRHANKDPKNKWWWYYQASYLANNIYNDKNLAIKIARKLANNSPDNAPLWTKQMVAILLSDTNHKCEAIKIIQGILDEYNKNDNKKLINDNEIDFMKFFIKQKLEELKEDKNFNPNNCL